MITSMAMPPSASNQLIVRNRQRDCPISTVRFKAVMRNHLEGQLEIGRYDLAVHLVSSREMAEINQIHLNHEGPTDVVTFDYADTGTDILHGELLICPAVARKQAREYKTRWEEEILRYFIHGILHLQGYDDRQPTDRRIMKSEENRRLKALLSRHSLRQLRGNGSR